MLAQEVHPSLRQSLTDSATAPGSAVARWICQLQEYEAEVARLLAQGALPADLDSRGVVGSLEFCAGSIRRMVRLWHTLAKRVAGLGTGKVTHGDLLRWCVPKLASYYAGLLQFVDGYERGIAVWPHDHPGAAGRSRPSLEEVTKVVYHEEPDDSVSRKVLKWVFFQFSGPMQQKSVPPIWLHNIAGDGGIDPRNVGPTDGGPVPMDGTGATEPKQVSCIAQLVDELITALQVDCDDVQPTSTSVQKRPFLTHFSALHTPTRAVVCALRGVCAGQMLIGACLQSDNMSDSRLQAKAAEEAALVLTQQFPELDLVAQFERRASTTSRAETMREGAPIAVAPPTPMRPDGRLADNGRLAKMIAACKADLIGYPESSKAASALVKKYSKHSANFKRERQSLQPVLDHKVAVFGRDVTVSDAIDGWEQILEMSEPLLLDHSHREQWKETFAKKVRHYEAKAAKIRRHDTLAKWTDKCKTLAATFLASRRHGRFQQAEERATDAVIPIFRQTSERLQQFEDLARLRDELSTAAYSSPYSSWAADAGQTAAYRQLDDAFVAELNSLVRGLEEATKKIIGSAADQDGDVTFCWDGNGGDHA